MFGFCIVDTTRPQCKDSEGKLLCLRSWSMANAPQKFPLAFRAKSTSNVSVGRNAIMEHANVLLGKQSSTEFA
ncbi:hypothetical protein ANCDUO_07534 [Ancylostoma duodenale]|uniref:Uncharacterized protein n=1 Tax=Ancylostoma duodenale TaxID=51022 RepID=A0A0C2DI91_9BILA|nr:hypothetical protein ANCDUO_07534 [Ancylostoma duodenale]